MPGARRHPRRPGLSAARPRLLAGAGLGLVALGVLVLVLVHGSSRVLNAVRTVTAGPQTHIASVSRPSPIVYHPSGFGSAKLPLVVALYGAGGCPQCMQGLTNFESLARREGFVVAYPGSGTSPPWNSPGDLAYVRGFIDQVIRTQNIDPSRVYLTGFSAGGRATYQYGCALSDKLAAIAIVSSVMRGYPCRLRHPVSELAILGSTEHTALRGNSSGILSAAATARRWRALDGCASSVPAQMSRAGAGGLVSQQLWGPCANGSRVGLSVLAGGYHTWPGTSSARGPDTRYDASMAIWQFFSSVRASSLTRPDAQVTAISSGTALLWVTLALGQPVTLRATLTHGHASLLAAVRHLPASPVVVVPLQGPASGRARLRLVIRDAYGRQATVVRSVKF